MTFSLNITGSATKAQEERVMNEFTKLLEKYGASVVQFAGWRGTFTGNQNLITKERLEST